MLGRNDASAEPVQLEGRGGLMYLPDSILKPKGAPPVPSLRLLDVEEKK